MSLNRYAKRRDENEPEIVEMLIRAGATVVRIDQPCDLLVGFRGRTYLLEVKRPAGPRGGMTDRHLTPAQQAFANSWCGDPLHVVTTPNEALAAIGAGIRYE